MVDDGNPYVTLGISRTADARTIKRAYTAAIRTYSPESHPEEFKRIRAAYELLSDEAARDRYDAADKGLGEYGPEVAARLENVEEALRQGKPELAERALLELIHDQPDVDIARVRLGVLHLRTQEWGKAAAQFRKLLERAPENARHHYHLGIALAGLDRREEGAAALETALDLDPKDADTRLAFAAQLSALQRRDEAIASLEAGILLAEPNGADALMLQVRRLDMLVGSRPLGQELDALVASVEKAGDGELSHHVASLLGSVAAHAFASERLELANQVMAACERLHPGTLLQRALPSVIRAKISDLPESGRAWLQGSEIRSSGGTLVERRWSWPLGGFLLSLGGFLLVCSWAQRLSTDVGFLHGLLLVMALGLSAGVVLSLREILEELSAPPWRLSSLHSVFLVRTRRHLAELYPLVQLGHVAGTHHHTNGLYTHSSLELRFGKERMTLHFRKREAADVWMQTIQGYRLRCLELLAEGCLDAIEGAEMFPAQALQTIVRSPFERTQRRAEQKSRMAWLAVGAAGVVLACVLIGTTLVRNAQDKALAVASQDRSAAGYLRYLREHPDGAHVALARREVDRAFARAAQNLRSAGLREDASAAVMFAALEALRQKQTTLLALDKSGHVEAMRAVIAGLGLEDVVTPVTGAAAKTPVVKAYLRPGERPGSWSFGLVDQTANVRFDGPEQSDALAKALYRALGGPLLVSADAPGAAP